MQSLKESLLVINLSKSNHVVITLLHNPVYWKMMLCLLLLCFKAGNLVVLLLLWVILYCTVFVSCLALQGTLTMLPLSLRRLICLQFLTVVWNHWNINQDAHLKNIYILKNKTKQKTHKFLAIFLFRFMIDLGMPSKLDLAQSHKCS